MRSWAAAGGAEATGVLGVAAGAVAEGVAAEPAPDAEADAWGEFDAAD